MQEKTEQKSVAAVQPYVMVRSGNMRRTRHTEKFEVDNPETEELCLVCRGRGQNWTRGYQMSLDEGWYETCRTCNGAGVRPKGTEAAEKRRRRASHRARLEKELKKTHDELAALDLEDKEY